MMKYVAQLDPKIILVLLLFPLGLYEGTQLALGKGSTISAAEQVVRFDAVGRFAILPLLFWLLRHFAFRKPAGEVDGWDVLFIAIGFGLAYIEAKYNILIVLP